MMQPLKSLHAWWHLLWWAWLQMQNEPTMFLFLESFNLFVFSCGGSWGCWSLAQLLQGKGRVTHRFTLSPDGEFTFIYQPIKYVFGLCGDKTHACTKWTCKLQRRSVLTSTPPRPWNSKTDCCSSAPVLTPGSCYCDKMRSEDTDKHFNCYTLMHQHSPGSICC